VDTRTDYSTNPASSDPGCTGPDDTAEKCTMGAGCPQCDDNADNDTDTLFDLADPGCAGSPAGNNEASVSAACADGVDNDADGYIDLDDWDCRAIVDPE